MKKNLNTQPLVTRQEEQGATGMTSCKECVPRCLDEGMARTSEMKVRAPEHDEKNACSPLHRFIQVFFQGGGWFVEARWTSQLVDTPTPLKKNLNTHPDVTRSCSWSCLGLGLGLCLDFS